MNSFIILILTSSSLVLAQSDGSEPRFSIGLGVLAPSYSQKLDGNGRLDVNQDKSGFSYSLNNVVHPSSSGSSLQNDHKGEQQPQSAHFSIYHHRKPAQLFQSQPSDEYQEPEQHQQQQHQQQQHQQQQHQQQQYQQPAQQYQQSYNTQHQYSQQYDSQQQPQQQHQQQQHQQQADNQQSYQLPYVQIRQPQQIYLSQPLSDYQSNQPNADQSSGQQNLGSYGFNHQVQHQYQPQQHQYQPQHQSQTQTQPLSVSFQPRFGYFRKS